MQVTETLSEGLKREYKITLPKADIDGRVEARLREVGQTVAIPGFRPGKAPLALLKTRFGAAVRGEVLESAVNDSTARAIEDRGIRPATQPKVEVTSFEEGGELEYKIALELMPEIDMVDFSTLAFERLEIAVPDQEIETTLAGIAAQHRHAEPVAEPRPSRAEDVLVIDFEGRIDGETFPGGSGEDFHVALDGSGFIPGFTEQLVGTSAGETKVVTARFPDDYPNPELAAKEAIFTVTVKEVREQHESAVDDHLATHLGYADLDELMAWTREQLERKYADQARTRLKRALFDQLEERHDFPVPPGMLEREFKNIWDQLEEHRQQGELDPEDADKDEATLEADYRALAERRVKIGLLLAEIGRENNLTLTDDEIRRAIARDALRYPGQEQRMTTLYRDNPVMTEMLTAPLLEDKVVDFILEMATVTTRAVTPQDLVEPAAETEAPAAKETKGAKGKATRKKPAAKPAAGASRRKKKSD